jgi:pimeloyl-ACP methyl ester carboxylesterase
VALKVIRVPTLLFYRGDDRLKWPDLGRGISAEIAGARFMEIPDAGHLRNIEALLEFNDAILTFLTEASPGR